MAGNGLVEESYICKLLEGGSLDTLKESGLRDEMFLTCKDQIQFIQKHEAEYKQLPDKMIFLQKFKDFQMLEVTESMDYLADRIKEQFLYTKLVPIVQEGGNLLREDSLKAYDYLRAALETLQKDNPVSKNREGVDIISSAKDRLSSYLKRCDMKVSFTMYQTIKPLWILLPVDMVNLLLVMWISVSQRYSGTRT